MSQDPSSDQFDLCVVAVGLGKAPVASDQRRGKALGEGDVYTVSHRVGAAQLVGALGERFCRPTPQWQALKIGNSDEPFVIADQTAQHRSTDGADHLDIKVGRGMHCLAAQSMGHRCP